MRRWALSLLVGFVTLLLVAAPASAHDGDPLITVEGAHPAGTSVHFIVKMVWKNDGDPINGKTVTATPTAPDGTAGAAVTLLDTGDGIYEGAVEMPTAGSWTVVIASPDPEGSITHTEVRPETTTTSTTSTPTTDADEPTAEQAAADQVVPGDGGDGEDDSSGTGAILIVAVALVVALGGGLLAIRTIRKNTPTPAAPAE